MREPATTAEQPGSPAADPSGAETPDRTEPAPCQAIHTTLEAEGPAAAIERLAADLDAAGDYRALLDALLLRARFELGLPLVAPASLADLTEPERTKYEERYVEAIRLVGSRHLTAGDIPTAWAYYRVIGENDPVAQAIREYRPDPGSPDDGDRLGAIIEVAFNHGVEPRRGFELILENYGTCSAISAFEGLPGHDEALRRDCAELLIRHLHRDLAANLRSDIAGRGQLAPPAGATIAEILAGRDWLVADDAYHIDVSHLASVVRMSVSAGDPEVIALAADLTEYGRRLSPRLQFEGVPPFERIFDDHRLYLRALLNLDADAAIAHFRGKIDAAGDDRESSAAHVAAQTLVNLLVRLGRFDEAIDISARYLAGLAEGSLFCPSIAQLCQRAGDWRRLADIARDRGDLVNYATAVLLLEQEVGDSPAVPG